MWPDLHVRDWISLHGLLVAAGLMTYVLASHTLRQRRHPAAAIGWVITLVLVPYLGLPLYLLFGQRKLVRKQPGIARAAGAAGAGPEALWPQQLAASMHLAPAAAYRSLRIHEDGGQALRALHELIDSATHTLDLCTFVLGRDPIGDALCEKLARRARDGVQVRLLIDGVGRMLGGYRNLRPLSAAGVNVAMFVPPLHSPYRGRINLRNHRKMAIADGAWLWCGGRNLASEYFDGAHGAKPWKDLTFDLHGALARRALECFERDWCFATYAPPPGQDTPKGPGTGPVAQLIPSGPDQSDDTVHALLVTACFNSRERIMAVTPYFVPDDTLLMALTFAASRNVAVDLVLPEHSNHRMADFARHRALRELASAGARVWLVPQMIHAKAVLVDHAIALAGSANLDARSLFLNYELMVAFYESADIQRFADWIDRQMHGARPYAASPPGLARDLAEGLVLWLAFQL